MSAKLGEILVRENLISSQQLREAVEYQRGNGGRLGSNLVKLGIISDDVITAVLSRLYQKRLIKLEVAMQRSSNADELKELIERGSGVNQSYGGQVKPNMPPTNQQSPYMQGRPIGQRPPVC